MRSTIAHFARWTAKSFAFVCLLANRYVPNQGIAKMEAEDFSKETSIKNNPRPPASCLGGLV